MMNDTQGKFQKLLRALFQFDCADLDFGIYRIMNHKRQVIGCFINADLPRLVSEELEKGALAAQAQAAQELQAARQKVLEALGEDALGADGNLAETYRATKAGKEYLAAQERAQSAKGREALEAAVYNHLYAFFSRYWQDGDFISKRRYSKKEHYAIPYNGEEVHLYWANHDQYYIKTGEYFTDYTWKAPGGVTVRFKVQAAQVEKDNVKGDKRFFLPVLDGISWDGERRTVTIPFEYRPLTEKETKAYGDRNQQEAILAKTLETIPQKLAGKTEALTALTAEKRKDAKGNQVSYLEHHLRQYTRRNTSDFFIHKDLKGFLSRELDFYLKNEVLNLEEMEAAGEDRAEGWFQLLRLVKSIGLRIIEFLAQIEDFQKMLWEKRKFITETFYCITVGNIPEAFYAEIAENEAQWREWKTLYGIEPPSPRWGEGRGEGVKSRSKAERSALITQLAREMRHAPTDAENRLWYFVRERRLGGWKFRRQHPIDRYIVDFICIEGRLIVELDGGQHAGGEQQQEKDEKRTRFLEGRGFRVLRFWNHEVLEHTQEVLEAIWDALENTPHPNPLPRGERESFLKAHPTLVLDTRHFSADFTDRLLATFEHLDEMTDGLLVHSENWQALNLLQEKYRERVKCIYIDPPYNTAATPILYKNDYKDSSWISLMADRSRFGKFLLDKSGVMAVAIDDEEVLGLRFVLSSLFEQELGIAVVRSNPAGRKTKGKLAPAHEYLLLHGKTEESSPSHLDVTMGRIKRFPLHDEHGYYAWANFIRSGSHDKREDRPKLFYPIFVTQDNHIRIPNMRWDEKNRSYELLEEPLFGEKVVYPVINKGGKVVEKNWQRGPERVKRELENYRVRRQEDGSISIDFKTYMDEKSLPTTWWDDKEYASANYGALELKSLFGEKLFDYSKSTALVRDSVLASGGRTDNSVVLDFFAGSGTTAHAVINLNRVDGGRRKFILVEMADYFDTVLLPRIKKVTFTPEWKDGKPLTPTLSPQGRGSGEAAGEGWIERSPRIVRVIRLESYEDALNNLSFDEEGGQQALALFKEDYLLRYMLKWETRKSETLLNVEKLNKPFDYCLHIHREGETRVQKVDLPETFNYLIGLDVKRRKTLDDNGRRYLVYRGMTRQGQRAAVIWRETENWTEEDYRRDRDFVAAHKLTEGADLIYVNGDSLISGARALETVFKARMFAGVEV